MSGQTILVCPVRKLDFSNVKDAGLMAQTLAQRIDAAPWTQAIIEVNVLSNSVAAGSKIEIQLVQDGYTASQPDAPNLGANIGDAATIDSSSGSFVTSAITSGLTSMVALQAIATQANPAVTCSAILEIRLTLKAQ